MKENGMKNGSFVEKWRRLATPASLIRLAALVGLVSAGAVHGAAAQDTALTGADAKGPVTLHLVSCCKTTYFGPAVDKWNSAHPDVQIQQEVIPFAQLNDILEARLRSRDTGMDILVVDPPRTAAFAVKKYLLDLSPVLGSKLKDMTNAESLAATSFRDKLYAVPVFNSTQVLIYNPDMLEKAGVTPPSIDPAKRTTWEEVVKDAEAVKAKLGTPYGIGFSQGQSYYQLQPIIMSAGGSTGLSGENNVTPDVNGPAWKKAMAWYGGLFEKGVAPRGVPFTQMDSLFVSGKAPFLATTTDRIREFENQKVKFGVAAFPYFEGGKAYTPCDSFALGVSPFSKYQKQAVDFLTWLGTTKEGGFAAAAQSPNVPANLLVRDEVSRQMEEAGTNLKGLTELIAYETSKTCVHRPQSVGYIQFETAFTETNLDIVNGADASDALDKMQSALKATFARLR
jgi:multiple sugar transport system substrate-binding protein